MSVSGIAFELPTNRQSRNFEHPAYDIHDPNYIPILNDRAEIRVDFSKPSFSALPSIPTPHENPAQVHLKRSKSGSAPETVVHSQSESVASRRFNVQSRNIEPQELGRGQAPANVSHNVPESEDGSATNSEHSLAVVSAQLEASVFMIPGNSAPKKEDLQGPAIPHSAQSSISSTKRNMVPTSRFSQKTPSLPSIPAAALRSASSSPFTSQRSTPDLLSQSPPPTTTPKSTPVIPIPPDPSPAPSSSIARLPTTKSTISERRARALHSHPYSHSKPNPADDEAEETPLIKQQTRAESRPGSVRTRSRTQSICSSHPATPAPNAPLPDLPPGVKRPPTRERLVEKNTVPTLQSRQPSPLPPSVPEKDHVEMADFMKTSRTTIFRRFDDVHIRLLLHLQDEISALERELLESEKTASQEPEALKRRPRIMVELRRVLAEYGEFSSQHSRASTNFLRSFVRELERNASKQSKRRYA